MRVLVTGGAGFIGSAIVDALLERGDEVRVLDALLPSVHLVRPEVDPRVDLQVEDVRDADAVARALDGVDVVSHQAAKVGLGVDLDDLPDYVGSNDLGTAVVLAETARAQVGRLVVASSMVVYGEGAYTCPEHGAVSPAPRRRADLDAGHFEPPCPVCGRPLEPGFVSEDARIDPRNGYAATKAAQEYLAATWARSTGCTGIALRYHNVYGPRMPRDTPYAGVAAIFRSALERGDAPAVFEDGGQRRDFVHVRDVASANVAAIDATVGSDDGTLTAYNVGTGEPHTIGEMAAALAEAFGGPAPTTTGQYRLGDVRHVTASSDRLKQELGWQPKVSFAAGMRGFASDPLRPLPPRRPGLPTG